MRSATTWPSCAPSPNGRWEGDRVDTVPESIELFERADLNVPLAPKLVWDLLTILALTFFLLDVAARRATFDTRAVREAAARAMARGEDASEASVAAWKRAFAVTW